MKKTVITFACMVLLSGLVVTGCGGGGAKLESTSVTKGQQLVDLKKAYDQGVITEKQYETEKKKILK